MGLIATPHAGTLGGTLAGLAGALGTAVLTMLAITAGVGLVLRATGAAAWARTGVRIAASWVTATAALLLALDLTG